MRRASASAGVGLALLVSVAAVSGEARAQAPGSAPAAGVATPGGTPAATDPEPDAASRGALVAKVAGAADVREDPGTGRVLWRARPRTAAGNATWLLVHERRETPAGAWVRVHLPIRPNGSSGWIDAERVVLARSPWRIVVDRRRRTLTLRRGGEEVMRVRVVVGARATPTPRGRFALYDARAQPDPRLFLGSWVLDLTAFSDVLEDFGGGPGRIAIHGRGGSSLRDPLGSARSHGCVRVSNAAAARLARLPPGTPVEIR